MRILFTTLGLAGHFFPLVPLGWACRAAGHDVLVACPEDYVPTALRTGLPATSSGPGWPGRRTGDLPSSFGLPGQRYEHGRLFGRTAARNLATTRSIVRSWRPDLVVSERAEFAGPIAAYADGIPQVELHWGAAALPEYRSGAESELRGPLTALGIDELPAPAIRVNPWPPSLRQPYAARHWSIRYVPYNGEARVRDWMLGSRDRPRVCVTLGTVVPKSGHGRFAAASVPILTALARLDAEFVVAVDDSVAAGWPTLPDNVSRVGRMPLSPVLAACDLVVHHGGQGTSLTALDAGLPQLMLPVFDDQLDNADAVAAAGAGVVLPPDGTTPSTVSDHCAELLAQPRFRSAARKVAAEIAAQPSPVEVANMVIGRILEPHQEAA